MEPKTEKAVRYKVHCLWGKADKEFKHRLYNRAALTLTEALREIPPSLFTNCKGLIAELFWKRGHVYKQDRRILEAAQDFNEALDINDNIGILDPVSILPLHFQ